MPTVADVLVDGLIEAGVPRLFGVPGGGSSLELLEAARIRGLPFVLGHQEWAVAIMAAVTGELLGRPGAVLSTLGPGVTASATGLAYAWLDRAPLLYLSDRHPGRLLEFTTHQRLDHAAHVGPIVKASLTVTAEAAGRVVGLAAELALREPRGPVHLDVPADVAALPAVPFAAPARAEGSDAPVEADVARAAGLIRAARRPVILAGLQCRASDVKWLRAFAESLPAPVLTTYKAKGAIPDPHPLALGTFTGGVLEEPVVSRADLIIAFGLDPVELIPRRWAYSHPVLALGRCPWPSLAAPSGGVYVTPVHEVVGDLGLILEDLAPRLVHGGARADWDVAEIDRLRRHRQAALEVAVPGLAPHRVVQLCRELTPAGAIATVDAGAHMFPATAYWQAVEPGECLISNGLATMGFALPAAIAAQLVHPERRVLCFTGDGGLMMVAAELETVVRLGLPIVVVVFDDAALSLIAVKQEQRGVAGAPMSYAGPDFAVLARAFGLDAHVAVDEASLIAAVEAALARGRPALIDARIDPSGYRRTLEIVRARPEDRPPPRRGARSARRAAGGGRGYNRPMAFLSARDEAAVKTEFERLDGPVTLSVFASELGPETNGQTVQLVKEVAALSDKLTVVELNPHIDREQAERYGIDLTPAIVVEGARDYGVRFLGIPAGYEFSNLIDSIIAVSRGEASLSAATKSALADLDVDVTIKVFATPT